LKAEESDPIGPDGLVLPEVGDWAETKYKLVEIYSQLFTTSMRDKWGSLAYVDLFASAGWGRVKGTQRIVPGTAFCALRSPMPFGRLVLCEMDPLRFKALKARVRREFPKANPSFVPGDSNAKVERIIDELPRKGRSRSVLTFCVVDPSKIADLRFATVQRLAFIDEHVQRPIDFLVLIPSFMDAHRERAYYLKPSSSALTDFLGNPDWREDWARETERRPQLEFGVFVVDAFGKSMQRLGYLWDLKDAILVSSGHTKLYHLAFFSRHPVGRKFAREARKYTTDQLGFQW
jgi:three-Cys-motif partner protein